MSMIRDKDFLKRMIQQLGAAIGQALGLRRERKFDEAFQALDGARHDLIQVPRVLLEGVDAAGVVQLIADPSRIRVWARLLCEEADLAGDRGLDPTGKLVSAAEVMLEATKKFAPTEEDRTFLKEVASRLPEGGLGPGYAARLREVVGS